jgi:tetratricopeptide (TPR) repeat protein
MRFMMAESYRKYNDYAQAAEAYKNIVTDDKSEQYPKAQFWYALMLKQMGTYNEARKQLEKYKAANRSRTELSEEINRELESAKWSKENQNRIAPIKIVHLGENVNSVYSDFNPFTTETNELIFTSLKKETKSNTESRSKLYAVENALKAGAGDLLESITLFDRYDQIGDGKVSLAFTLSFRASDRTLTSDEVAKYRDQAVASAAKSCGAILRS